MKPQSVVLVFCLAISAPAQSIVIESLQGNGVLTWNGDATNFTRYTVEWSPSVTGPWSASWSNLTSLTASNGAISVSVPMFYRVLGAVPTSGEKCDDAITLSAAGTYAGTTAGHTNDYDGAAAGVDTPGPDQVYRMTVPAGQKLTVLMTPAGSPLWDGAVLLLSGSVSCDAAGSNILAAVDPFGTGLAETAGWVNAGVSAQEVLIVVDGASVTDEGDYQLAVSLSTPPPGDVCELAETVSTGPTLGLTTLGYADDRGAGSGCIGTAGADRFFKTTIPAGETLTVLATPTSAWDPSLSIVSGDSGCPAPASCLTSEDAGGDGAAETAQYTNTSGSALEVFIVVDSFTTGAAGSGGFDLMVTLGP